MLASCPACWRGRDRTALWVYSRELEDSTVEVPAELAGLNIPRDVRIYEINGPFFFGAAETFTSTIQSLGRFPRVLIVRMRNVPAIDATGIMVLRNMCKQVRASKGRVIISEIHSQPHLALESSGFYEEFGEDVLATTIVEALELAKG